MFTCLGKSLYPGYQKRRKILLEKFHGIKVEEKLYHDKENLLEIIHKILPYSPIILFCDVFDCPWNISYKRNHIKHYILISGFDDITNRLYVLDPYSTLDQNSIDINDIVKENGYIHYFSILPTRNILLNEYHLEIANSLNHINDSGFFQNLENFYNDFETRFEEVILSDYKDVYAIPLVLNLRCIANQRYCYCFFLNKLNSKELIDPSIFNMMQNIAEKYSLLRILLIKQIIRKRTNSKDCSDIIAQILSNEYDAFEKMKSFK